MHCLDCQEEGGFPMLHTASRRLPWTLLILSLAFTILLPHSSAQYSCSPITPGAFLENRGQWTDDTLYIATLGDTAVRVERGALAFDLRENCGDSARGAVVRYVFEGADPSAKSRGLGRSPGVYNFFVGSDPERWATNVLAYPSIAVAGLHPEVELLVGTVEGRFSYDFMLSPTAAHRSIVVRVEGARSLSVDPDGAVIVTTDLGVMRQSAPRTFDLGSDGRRSARPSRCRQTGVFTFELECDAENPLVIDPGIEWSTFLGGTQPAPFPNAHSNWINDAVADDDGSVVLVGGTGRIDFPTTPGAYQESYAGNWADAFVSRLSADGATLIASTFIGGAENVDITRSVARTPGGALVIGGDTGSSDCPQTPGAYSPGPYVPSNHPMISRLDASLSRLEYSVLLGTTNLVDIQDISLTQSEDVLMAGMTAGIFPTTVGAFDTTYGGNNLADGFVFRLAADGSALLFSTFLGGTHLDTVCGVAEAPDGTIVAGGWTRSEDFPITPGALDPFYTTSPFLNRDEGFVTAFDPTGSSLVFSTFLGGIEDDQVRRVEVNGLGMPVVSGRAFSPEFPTTPGSFQPSCSGSPGCRDVFVSKLAPDSKSLVASTFFGGGDIEYFYHMHLDPSGAVTIAGDTYSNQAAFPTTTGAYEEDYISDFSECYVARFTPDLRSLAYSTLFGTILKDGSNNFGGGRMALAVDPFGSATVAGKTESSEFPVTEGAYDPVFNGHKLFVTRFDMLPTGASRYGSANQGCASIPAIGVIGSPTVGLPGFAITGSHVASNGTGYLGVSFGALASPLPIGAAQVLLDPASLVLVPIQADALGYAALAVPIRAGSALALHPFHAQLFWPDACAPGGIAASQALRIEAQ